MGSSERHGGYGDVFPAQAASAFDAIHGGIGAGQGSAAWILERYSLA
jgi:3-oxoacyl-(acyl-carrier-protein) synthase